MDGQLYDPADADAVLQDWGAPLTSAGTPGLPVPASARVLGYVRSLAVTTADESGLAVTATREVLVTRRGAVAFADGQRVVLGGRSGGPSLVVRGRAEGVPAGAFDHWLVVRGGAVTGGAVR